MGSNPTRPTKLIRAMEAETPGLKPDPQIDEWLQRQRAKQGARWPQADEVLDSYRTAIAALDHSVRDCPPDLWDAPIWEVKASDPWMSPPPDAGVSPRSIEEMQVFGCFWYVAFHCIFYLDFYLSQLDPHPYRAPQPFGGEKEHDVDDNRVAIAPYQGYTQDQLLDYLRRGLDKAEKVFSSLTVEQAATPCPPTSAHAGRPFSDLLRINLDHVREHGEELRAALAR